MKLLMVVVFCLAYVSDSRASPTTSPDKGTTKCPDGYTRFKESCYLLNNEVTSWIEAYQMCLLFGGYLIEVDDTNEYSFIQGYLNEHGQGEGISLGTYRYQSGSYGRYETENRRSYAGYWMGANSIELPGHWFWMKSRKIVDFDIFGKADINVTDSSCLCFDRSNMSQSRNKKCHTQMYSICERNTQ
uniref:C-type lectin domain-containing protein n=6 Tax=Magallana gigas TaxID=29159 RepID=A0A8W8LW24_MAGGI|nr:perlucin-like protein [Crassostrea gigas]